MDTIRLLYIDLFCGAGGTSTGVAQARLDGKSCASVIACVNHDANAIASHASNHPEALHFTEDIRTLELSPLIAHILQKRKEYPGAKVVLWASLECTNFSKAKGGLPRDADSRTLAEHLFRYIEAIDPDFIQIENVEEFMCWGDLDANGRPLSRDKGRCYLRWVNQVKRYGYDYEYRILNAANFGAYTSRTRFFGQFAKHGLPIVFPEPTHTKHVTTEPTLFESHLEPWRPVREVLDLSNTGVSIFGREKPLCEKTLDRIYAGLIKFVAGGKEAFLLKYNSVNGKTGHHVPPSIDAPCPTVACQARLGLVGCQFLSKQFSGDPYDKNVPLDAPSGTVTTKDHHALISADFISTMYSNGQNKSLDSVAPAVTTSNHLTVVSPKFLSMVYSPGYNSSLEQPSGTVTCQDRIALISSQYLLNPQYQSKGGSIHDPCFTLIAHMDKTPPYLVSTEQGVGIEIYETDSPKMQLIKQFMAMYGIIDIHMRMLTVTELKKIMGFPADYILKGNQTEQKKFIGNAVEVNMSRVLCESLCRGLQQRYDSIAV